MACFNDADRLITTPDGAFKLCLPCYGAHRLQAQWMRMEPLHQAGGPTPHRYPCECPHVTHVPTPDSRRIDPAATEAAIVLLDGLKREHSVEMSQTAWSFLEHAAAILNGQLREYVLGRREAYPEPPTRRVYFAIYLLDEGTGEAFHTYYFCSERCAVTVRDEDKLVGRDVEGNVYSAIITEPMPGNLADGTVCEQCDREIR